MPDAKRPTKREREYSHYLHMEEYIEVFLKRWSRPRQRWPAVQQALEEVRRERLLLAKEMEDANMPSLRRNYTSKPESDTIGNV